ncbi:hypothetical protein M427DRAFT_36070 [Gonapodya prolifera JEL478]|uniref:Uncharacterized protein n=1 Tax=Gonapodya prolifera (strain JEL478) TaxID=1344416 RepID=A0A139A471_GONPJ|nr:hypothetical protein M427DRAFT_36070 [Gonapodya prolifera JEL478]|eukprot:KXS11153.1 hypothetical protein M427DRAFT_36070 [Gonapodya prolifera JEL478]
MLFANLSGSCKPPLEDMASAVFEFCDTDSEKESSLSQTEAGGDKSMEETEDALIEIASGDVCVTLRWRAQALDPLLQHGAAAGVGLVVMAENDTVAQSDTDARAADVSVETVFGTGTAAPDDEKAKKAEAEAAPLARKETEKSNVRTAENGLSYTPLQFGLLFIGLALVV